MLAICLDRACFNTIRCSEGECAELEREMLEDGTEAVDTLVGSVTQRYSREATAEVEIAAFHPPMISSHSFWRHHNPSSDLWAAQALGVLVEEMMGGGWSLAASWGIISG